MQNVRNLALLFFTLFTGLIVHAQDKEVWDYLAEKNFKNWDYFDFKKRNIKKVEVYSINIEKNGRPGKDSVLHDKREVDDGNKKVFGLYYNPMVRTHSPPQDQWNIFEEIYNDKGQVIRHAFTYLDKLEKDKVESLRVRNENKLETSFEYDKNGNLVKEITTTVSMTTPYSDSFFTSEKDIIELYYDENGKRIKQFNTKDSIRYLSTGGREVRSPSCNYCQPRYKIVENSYDVLGQLKIHTSYTPNGEMHTRSYYYYDNNGGIAKKLDSTGWYISSINPYVSSETFYAYTDSGKTMTEFAYTDHSADKKISKTTNTYDKRELLTSSRTVYDFLEYRSDYFYSFEQENLVSVVSIENSNQKVEQVFRYNKLGMLEEYRRMRNGKVNKVLRYYYH